MTKKFDLWVIPRLIIFVFLSFVASTPLHIFVEGMIGGKHGAPDFITVPFLIYALCAKLVFGFGYVVFGHKLPVKNTVLRAFSYIMLIYFSSYLPNILAMAGGDGKIIGESLSVSIVIVDSVSYLLEGLILGLLMNKYAVEKTEAINHPKTSHFVILCAANGLIFSFLNFALDFLAGIADKSWRLCGLLKVTSERELTFYIVFLIFMFVAGVILPLWYKYFLPSDASFSKALFFALKLSFFVWLPNVLIMIFFGTPVLLTLAYGLAYTLMIAVCVLALRKLLK